MTANNVDRSNSYQNPRSHSPERSNFGSQVRVPARVNSFFLSRGDLYPLFSLLFHFLRRCRVSCTVTGTVSHTFIRPSTLLLIRHSIFSLPVPPESPSPYVSRQGYSPHLSDFPPPITPSSFTRHSLFPALHVLCPRLYTHKESNQSKVEGEKGVEGEDRARPEDVCDFMRHIHVLNGYSISCADPRAYARLIRCVTLRYAR